MQEMVPKHLQHRLASIKILVVDDDHHMRKVVRTMLNAIGVKNVHDAMSGAAGLTAVRDLSPDIVLLDWEMPMLDGPQFVRMVRSPGAFPRPDVPIIMLTGHGDRWRVMEATRLGVHEYLLKPVSTKALLARIMSVLTNPRPFVQYDGYYGPAPRRVVVIPDEPETDPHGGVVMLN